MTKSKPPDRVAGSNSDECIEHSNHTSLHISENGVGATFRNPRRRRMRKIHYDGCYKTTSEGRRADYIVGLHDVVDVILELKGSDLKHAVKQVEETLKDWQSSTIRFPQIVCLIVYGHTFPRMTSRLGTIERDFLLAHRTFLWLSKSGSERFSFRKLRGISA